MLNFAPAFNALTGNPPFPWQQALYKTFAAGDIPASCNLPTGLGKTSVIAVWLIALANHPDKMPRRLVYVVNRRTVVDQTTDEVEKYRDRIHQCEELGEALLAINSPPPVIPFRPQPLALSTLRGQFADNREWSADPSRPAVICGTVDMIGSRLLFSGYGVGMKAKPLHAGFLGQDSLVVHDEAHLEPAFQELLLAIEKEQKRERATLPKLLPWPTLRVMELTATPRGMGEVFPTDEQRKQNEANGEVARRIDAAKTLSLHQPKADAKLTDEVAAKALAFEGKGAAVLVFLQRVADVQTVMGKLPAGRKQQLTGTIRGLERERMADPMNSDGCPIFARFLPPQKDAPPEHERWKVKPAEGTVYLVCTSAGEVGVNISADHLVCDLTTFESMAQRLGRVNRFGKRTDTEVHVFHPNAYDPKLEYDTRRQRTKALLSPLEGKSVSPKALGELGLTDRIAAFAPPPMVLPASDILFDAWALTTIKGKLPGRPSVEPYLHGIVGWEPPETHVAWREEVGRITDDLLAEYKPKDLLDDYPLKPHELLREPSQRAFKQFEVMAKRLADQTVPVWLVDDDGEVEILTLVKLADKDSKERIEGKTVLLPPFAGGLEDGMLNGNANGRPELDVADEWYDAVGRQLRVRVSDEDEAPEDMHPILRIDFAPPEGNEDAEENSWLWFVLRNEGDKSAKLPVRWEVHVSDVEREARKILDGLKWSGDLRAAIETAAALHDHGKKRKVFQAVLGNTDPNVLLAKSGKKGGRVKETYRHEFGSLLDVAKEPDFQALTDDQKELVLHLIAAHHGRARPHFPPDEAFDPERPQQLADEMAAKVPQRFARLQRRYGRWGLAYLESLLRAADWAASANPSQYVKEGDQ